MLINVKSLRQANELITFNKDYQKNWISIRETDFSGIIINNMNKIYKKTYN